MAEVKDSGDREVEKRENYSVAEEILTPSYSSNGEGGIGVFVFTSYFLQISRQDRQNRLD
jgi:hypothetical protein